MTQDSSQVTESSVKSSEAKSGLRRLAPGEILFHDGDKASSLFIIQKGQLRLFKPKGKGFIEIAVLRSGEVIGEMAYFDDTGGQKRSCSASAMVTSEIIEISFVAFAKTMSGLNPWFKTIIITLANRLRATNSRVKELETNSTTVNYTTGKQTGYEFLKTNDLIKLLGTVFLVFKSHGEKGEKGHTLHRKTLDLYAREIYMIMEAKLDTLLIALEELGELILENDPDGLPKLMTIKNIDYLRSLFIFYNTEKHLADDKKLKISNKTQLFLEKIWHRIQTSAPPEGNEILVRIDDIIKNSKTDGSVLDLHNLEDAKDQQIVGEAVTHNDEISLEVNWSRLKKLLPTIKFINKIHSINESKT